MGIIKEDNGLISGGGNAVSGDGFYDSNNVYQTETTSDGQDMRIETGLSTVKRFMLMARPSLSAFTSFKSVLEYDADVDSSNFGCCFIYNGGAYGSSPLTIGTGDNQYCCRMMSISGGTITLKSASRSDYGKFNNIRWFAE